MNYITDRSFFGLVPSWNHLRRSLSLSLTHTEYSINRLLIYSYRCLAINKHVTQSPWQYLIQQHLRFFLFFNQLESSFFHDIFEVASVLFQPFDECVHQVDIPVAAAQ